MPNKACPVCRRQQQISSQDWPLVSRLDFVVCSRKCAWDFIREGGWGEPLLNAIQPPHDEPDASYSDLLGMFFRSEYERHVAEAFSESGIVFEYEKYAFPVKHEGVFWTPDFYLPEHRMFVEVKGAWGASAKSKVISFTKMYPDVVLLMLPWTLAREFYPEGAF